MLLARVAGPVNRTLSSRESRIVLQEDWARCYRHRRGVLAILIPRSTVSTSSHGRWLFADQTDNSNPSIVPSAPFLVCSAIHLHLVNLPHMFAQPRRSYQQTFVKLGAVTHVRASRIDLYGSMLESRFRTGRRYQSLYRLVRWISCHA